MSGKPWRSAEIEILERNFPKARWRDLLTALPGRTRAAINIQARGYKIGRMLNQSRDWSVQEVGALRQYYPVADEPIILERLPGRTWASIVRKASTLGVRRPLPGSRLNKRHIHPVIRQLRQERERQYLTRAALAKRLGYHQNQILSWELGKTKTDFQSVVNWAIALDMEIIIRPSAKKLLDEAPIQSTQQRLMAGR